MESKRETEQNNLLPEKGNPLHETVTYKIGGTFYEVSTSCGGSERLYDKMKQLIKSETVKTSTIVNEFIKKIVVHAPKKIDGKRFQKVDMIFNFVGEIHFPPESQTERKQTSKQEKTAQPLNGVIPPNRKIYFLINPKALIYGLFSFPIYLSNDLKDNLLTL